MSREVVQVASGSITEHRQLISDLVRAIELDGIGLPKEDFKVSHHFAPMQYAREIVIPAGIVLVGKIHKQAHVNVISAGACTVYTAGEGAVELTAPCTFVSQAGAQRVILAHVDVVWTTIHVTDKTDLAEIEREVIQED